MPRTSSSATGRLRAALEVEALEEVAKFTVESRTRPPRGRQAAQLREVSKYRADENPDPLAQQRFRLGAELEPSGDIGLKDVELIDRERDVGEVPVDVGQPSFDSPSATRRNGKERHP